MFVLFRRAKVSWEKMASNPHRFVPYQWLAAALRMQRPSNYDFTSDTNSWPSQRLGGASNQVHQPYPYMNNSFQRFNFQNTSNAWCSTTSTRNPRENKKSRSQRRRDKSETLPDSKRSRCDLQNKEDAKLEEKERSLHPHTSSSTSSQSSFRNHRGWEHRECHRRSCSPSHTQTAVREKSDSVAASAEAYHRQDDHELYRKWQEIETPQDNCTGEDANQMQIRVMSYNILSQTLLRLNRSLYHHCDKEALPWEYRWANLRREIADIDADVLCLQEIEECHFYDDICPFLDNAGYQCHYKRRTGNNASKPDGVLTAFKKANFQLVEEKKVEYYRGEIELVNQHNVGLITVLKPVSLNTEESIPGWTRGNLICVVNTHLLYSPKRGDVKLVQLATLFAEVHRVLSGFGGQKIPILLCGDFNSTSTSLVYDFVTRQHIEFEGLEARVVSGQKTSQKGKVRYLPDPLLPSFMPISDDCCFLPPGKERGDPEIREAYQLRHSLGPLLSAHVHDRQEASTTQDGGITVDYIFYTPCDDGNDASCECGRNRRPGLSLHLRRRLGLIFPRQLRIVRGIPNSVHSSDHLPIVADFVVSKEKGDG